jgi:Protein of unknown function DUF262
MSKRALFDSPTIARLQTVIESIREGELLFPEFQRPFVWKDAQRLRLLDSILKGLPIGSLLVWRSKGTLLRCKSRLGSLQLPEPADTTIHHDYVLDGLQRLTTLYGALSGTTTPYTDEQRRRWPIYFDLETDLNNGDEKRFQLPSLRRKPPANWLPMAALLNGELRWEHQQRLYLAGRADLANKIEHLDRVFKDYTIAIVPIVTDDLRLATTSFERVNTQGTKMGEPHMLRALTYRHDFDLDKVLGAIMDRLPWRGLSSTLLIRTLKVIENLDVYEKDLSSLIEPLRDPRPINRLERGLTKALAFLAQSCKIIDNPALPYAFQLVALASAASRGFDLSSPVVAARLEAWLWITTYTEYFKGKTGDQLQHIFDDVRSICAETIQLPADLPKSCALLERFNASSVRSLMLMHLLARRSLVDIHGARVDGPRLVARGSTTFAKLYLEASAEDPANRILVDPLDAVSLREALGDRNCPRAVELREAHLLPPWTEPEAADQDHVLSWRRERLRELEVEDLTRLGLQVEEASNDG